MNLFFASTPYNIFNAILLKTGKFKDIEADIYISDFAQDNYVIADRIKEEGIFRNVYKVKQYKYVFWSKKYSSRIIKGIVFYSRKLHRNIFKKKNYKEMCGFVSDTKYDEFFLDTLSEAQLIAAKWHKKLNPNLKLNFYEVGTENYVKIKILDKYNHNKREAKKQYANMKPDSFHVHRPEICPSELIDDTPIYKIPSVDKNNINIINRIFGFSEKHKELLKNDIIFFDQATDFDQVLINIYKEITNLIYDILGDKFVMKLHPRTEYNYHNENIKVFSEKMSFEVLAANCDDLDEKIFISNNSTAMLVPKLIFDKEPIIIQINDIFMGNEHLKKKFGLWLPFNEEMKSIYKDKNKIINTSSPDELKQVLIEVALNKGIRNE